MKVEQMREQLIHVYSGPTWRMRVLGMENRQVIAIYKSMQEEGRLVSGKSGKKKPASSKNQVKAQEDSIQLNIWDYLNGKESLT